MVCSAMAGITDRLIDISRFWKNGQTVEIENSLLLLERHFCETAIELFSDTPLFDDVVVHIREVIQTARDAFLNEWTASSEKWLLGLGEILTSALFARFLSLGACARWLNAYEFMWKNPEGEPDLQKISQILSGVVDGTNNIYHVTQGFICMNAEGYPDHLQRGGGDYSATLLGAALNAKAIEIWTDINGVHNNDPRIVPGTRPIREMSYCEAAELAYFGAKILHPVCVWPAARLSIPVYLKYTMDPEAFGTLISDKAPLKGLRAIAAKDGITIIRIRSARMLNAYGFLRKVFEVFEDHKTPIDAITTSEVAVSLTIDNSKELHSITEALSGFGSVETIPDMCLVCVVGDVMNQGHASLIMNVLRNLDIKMVSFGGSDNNLTLVLPNNQKALALKQLQTFLFGSKSEIGENTREPIAL